MSSMTTSKRPITPKKQQSQQRDPVKDDVRAQISLPPSVEGRVYAILICHIPKLRWVTKYQSLCRSATIKVTWWGEDDPSATFKPHISGTPSDYRQQPHITAKYCIRSELKPFSKYLTDAAELVLKVSDTETNRILGTVKIQNLSTLSISNPIKGYQPIFSNKGDKLGELFVSLRLFLPGPHDSNENLIALSFTSDTSNPRSRRDSIGSSDFNQDGHFENGLRTYTLDRPYTTEQLPSVDASETTAQERYGSTVPFQAHRINSKDAPPGMKKYKELPTGKVVEELIEKANRLRENMIKSSLQKTTPVKKTNSRPKSALTSNKNTTKYDKKSFDGVDSLVDQKHIYDSIGRKSSLKSSASFNGPIITDLDGLENDQSLLDDLLYGGTDHADDDRNRKVHSARTNKRNHSYSKPPTGRSRSSSLTRVNGSSIRSRSGGRNRSSDSDIASRISWDTHKSDVDDSGNETSHEEELSAERIQLLSYVRTARIRIDYLRLNTLNGGASPSHSSFGRTNKSKRALTYYVEYQFPMIVNNHNGLINEGTEVMKIASKHFEFNNDITFSHLSTYPCLFNQTNFKTWWCSLLIFKIYSRMSGTASPEQIGFAVLPFRNLLQADYLHLEHDLNVLDRTEINPNEKLSIGQLHLMVELDSEKKDFKDELDRMQSIERMKPKRSRVSKSKRKKKSIKNSEPKGFRANEPAIELSDGLVLQIYLSIIEARNIPSSSNTSNLPRNLYFVCRAFWSEEPITSVVCWGSSTPKFNFEQKTPLLLTKSTLEKMHQNFVIIELWDKKISDPSDQLIGITKIPLEQFFISYKDKQISRVLLRAQYPVISTDSWLPIIDPFKSTTKSSGEIQVLLAMGTSDQITAVQVAHSDGDLYPSLANKTISTVSNNQSLIEHHFEIMIENINGLRAFESMVWGESDCFIQYLFPIQEDKEFINPNSIKPFQLRTIRTATTLCTSDPTFHDTNKFCYRLSPADALHKYFYAACQATTPMDACIQFEVWSRFYYPNIRDQLLGKGKLSSAKLCSMTTMLESNIDDKSIQSFRIPLEIVTDDSQHHYSSNSNYGGDLLLTVTYKRTIVKRNESQITPDRLSNDHSQVCISIDLIRACGLKYATARQAEHDTRFNYPSQVGVNTYVKLTCSFLSDIESRTTRTIAHSFIPEYNQTIDFPLSLIWSDHRNQSISLAEMLEHGELKIDLYHQMNTNEKPCEDVLLCYCRIPLKELLDRQTGIKGWHPLSSANNLDDHCMGGIELCIRFSHQDDRRRLMASAKSLGWISKNSLQEETFLDDQKDLGCLVKISIDHIKIPLVLLTQSDPNRTNIFAQYRFYDKMPIITKRKRAIVERENLICTLDFNKEHLFLCAAPFFWYLREEKLEVQIWSSENDAYDYSQSLASSNDKLLGSIYFDLSLLLNKQRKSHRFSSILPLFKQGTKDLRDACVHIKMSIDKSEDFNELRTRNHPEASNDVVLETRYLDSMNNDHALRAITNNIFPVVINIEQAAHLPTIYSQNDNLHHPPNPYVTYSAADSNQLYRTQVLTSTSRPQWNYQQKAHLSIEHLFNEKKVFILQLWHAETDSNFDQNQTSMDKTLGFVSIDLSPLLSGLQKISGWYNITDTLGNVQGQLKISIVPLEDLLQWKQMKYQSKPSSYRSTTTTTTELSARSTNTDRSSLSTSHIDDDSSHQSFLMTNLRRQLGELDVITERLKSRYYSNSEIPSTDRSDISIRPSSVLTSTLQSDFLEQFPESSIGKPLISDGLNVTDILSLHNDQVRLAQELMTKANHLLESSKDFFLDERKSILSSNCDVK